MSLSSSSLILFLAVSNLLKEFVGDYHVFLSRISTIFFMISTSL